MFININRYWRCYGCNTLNLEVNVIKYHLDKNRNAQSSENYANIKMDDENFKLLKYIGCNI